MYTYWYFECIYWVGTFTVMTGNPVSESSGLLKRQQVACSELWTECLNNKFMFTDVRSSFWGPAFFEQSFNRSRSVFHLWIRAWIWRHVALFSAASLQPCVSGIVFWSETLQPLTCDESGNICSNVTLAPSVQRKGIRLEEGHSGSTHGWK